MSRWVPNVFINQHYWSNCISWYCGIILRDTQKYPMAMDWEVLRFLNLFLALVFYLF